jgi:hypothetical protein
MTTDSYELPELPDRYAQMPKCEAAPSNPHCANAIILTSVAVYTADQMRAYATQAVLAERERCIAACRKVRQDLDEYAERNNYHGDAWEYIDKCEAAIRKG